MSIAGGLQQSSARRPALYVGSSPRSAAAMMGQCQRRDQEQLHAHSALCDGCDVCQCTRLFRNQFRIKGTPESGVKRPNTRNIRRKLMAPERFSSPDEQAMGAADATASPLVGRDASATYAQDAQSLTPQKINESKIPKPRFPLEEFDPNSQDSGYGGNYSDEKRQTQKNFQFAEPARVAPRRLSLDCRSPLKSPVQSSPQRMSQSRQPSQTALFRSLSSGYESTDDGFNELIDMEMMDDKSENGLPNGLSSLICGNIVTPNTNVNHPMELDEASTPENPRTRPHATGFRRCQSLQVQSPRSLEDLYERSSEDEIMKTPGSKVRSCLFRSPNANSSASKLTFDENPRGRFKRPEPPADHSPTVHKRSRKCTSFQINSHHKSDSDDDCEIMKPVPKLQRSISEVDTHAQIKRAVHRSETNEDLTGDFSKPCCLPLENGKHHDLKSITAQTLAKVINGDYTNLVDKYTIIDCRYPYEYAAGHIQGAINLYTKELIEEFFLAQKVKSPSIEPDTKCRRNILVFHCEFSFERGPTLSRFLRSIDRQRNSEYYPALHYPEMYLLHGGYERFYREIKHFCEPMGYRPMKDPAHENELKQFRSKSKSWQGEKPKPNGPMHLKKLYF